MQKKVEFLEINMMNMVEALVAQVYISPLYY